MKKLLFLVLVLSYTINGGGLKSSELDQKIISHLFNGECEIADSLLEINLNNDPNNPKYLFLKAHYWFYARYFSEINYSRDSVLTLIETYSQKAIDAGLRLKPTLENRFYMGSSYGFLSRVNGMRQDYWNAFWAAKDCRNYLESVLDDDPEFYDAYMGLGVIEYYAGKNIDGFLGAIAWLVGMAGDADLGLKYFQNVYEKGTLLKTEARFALPILTAYLEQDTDRSIPMYDQFLSQHPENRMMKSMRIRLQIYEEILAGNLNRITATKDSLANQYRVTNAYVLAGTARSLLKKEMEDEAIKTLLLNIELFPDDAYSYSSLGDAYVTLNKAQDAKKYFELALEKLPENEIESGSYQERLRDEVIEKIESL
ncbi:MAG: hypothetical protein KKA84_05030 [Bacteroidetes bacterium]|nr:hypothetical protein [Bacteroidota bacterium]